MKNISLKNKIFILSFFMALVVASVGGISYWSTTKTVEVYSQIVEHEVPAIRAVNRMLLSFRWARIELLQMVSIETDENNDQESLKTIEQQWQAFDTDAKLYESHVASEKEEKLFAEFKTAIDKARQGFDQVIADYKKGSGDKSPEHNELVRIVFKDIGGPISLEILAAAKNLRDHRATSVDDFSKQAKASAQSGNQIIFMIAVFGSILGLGFAFLFSNQISRKFIQATDAVRGAVAESFRISEVLAKSSSSLASSSQEQAAAIQESVSALSEMSSMIAQTGQNVKFSMKTSDEAHKLSSDGSQVMEKMGQSMESIQQANVQLQDISRVIEEINSKTKVINDIVFKTQLLSFNASIEAARAGQHGRGFAVVAEEVGNLADISGQAATEIEGLLGSS
jgi:methyl-accepting chemotaxis protein